MLYTKEVVCLGSDSEAEYIEHAEKLRQVKAVLEEVYIWIYLLKFSYICISVFHIHSYQVSGVETSLVYGRIVIGKEQLNW